MTPEVEKKRRELFEEIMSQKYSAAIGWHERDENGYLMAIIRSQWDLFNAALDAVEIDLVDPGTLSASDSPWEILEHCREAITDTGLGLRIKE